MKPEVFKETADLLIENDAFIHYPRCCLALDFEAYMLEDEQS